jgi:hypothetical protein
MKGVFVPRIAGTVLLALAASFAQNTSPGAVRWKYGAPNAVIDIKNASKIEGLKTDDIHIYVALYDLKDTEYNGAWVQISNYGQAPIEFNPESAFLKDDLKVRAETPDGVAESILRLAESKSQELSSPHCNVLMTGHNNGGGSAAASACQATDTQKQLAKDIVVFSNARGNWIREKSLRRTTVAPGEQVVGAILFRKGKKRTDYMLAIPVNGKTFEFPVSAENRPSSYD